MTAEYYLGGRIKVLRLTESIGKTPFDAPENIRFFNTIF
jgi:hypothetical protein